MGFLENNFLFDSISLKHGDMKNVVSKYFLYIIELFTSGVFTIDKGSKNIQ